MQASRTVLMGRRAKQAGGHASSGQQHRRRRRPQVCHLQLPTRPVPESCAAARHASRSTSPRRWTHRSHERGIWPSLVVRASALRRSLRNVMSPRPWARELQLGVDLGVDRAVDRLLDRAADRGRAVAAHQHAAVAGRATRRAPRRGRRCGSACRCRRRRRGSRSAPSPRRGIRPCGTPAAARCCVTPNGITLGEWLCTTATTSGRAR